MAQYGQGLYGEMKYGVIGAKYGTYTSSAIDAGLIFEAGMGIRITYIDNKINYLASYVPSGKIDVFTVNDETQWTKSGNGYKALIAGAKITLSYSGANAALNYISTGTLSCSEIQLDKERVTTTSTYIMPAQATAVMTNIPNNDEYSNYQITFTCAINTIINSSDIFVNGVSMQVKASTSYNGVKTKEFADMNTVREISVTQIPGTNTYLRVLSFNASDLTTNSIYQYSVTLYSSDSLYGTYVNKIEILSEDAILYMPTCQYIVDTNKSTVLTSTELGLFNHYTTVTWTEASPTGTRIEIRSSAGNVTNQMTSKTPIYKMGASQARLKPNATTGWFLSPRINFDVINTLVSPNKNTTRSALLSKVNIAYTIGSNLNTMSNVTYTLYVNGHRTNMIPTDGSHTDVKGYAVEASGVNCQLRIELNRNVLSFSPSVDSIGMFADCAYYEAVNNINYLVSAVEQEKVLVNTSSLKFFAHNHPKIVNATYTVSSTSPEAVFYLGCTSGLTRSATATIVKSSDTNIVCYSTVQVSLSARAQKLYPGTGVIDEDTNIFTTQLRFMNNFNPVLSQQNGKKYLYRIYNSSVQVAKVGDIWRITEGIKDTETTYKFSVESLNRDNYTEQTTMNFPLPTTIDTRINITTKFSDELSVTTWTSSEKVYSGYINILGDKEPLVLNLDILPDLNPDAFFNVADEFTLEKYTDGKTNYQMAKLGPYNFRILENSVFMVPKPWSSIAAPITRIIIKQIDLINSTTTATASATIIKGSNADAPLVDRIPSSRVLGISSIKYKNTIYNPTIDYLYNPIIRCVEWQANATMNGLKKGEMYEVEYSYIPYKSANIEFECDYSEPYTEKTAWASSMLNTVSGTCSYDKDASLNISSLFPYDIFHWSDLDTINDSNGYIIDGTMKYYIHSTNNEYVNCLLNQKGDGIVATMGGVRPSEDWMLKVHGGYYYLQQDECFKYNNKVSTIIDQNIPIISDCDYTTSTSKTGALVCHDTIVSVALNNNFTNQSVNVSNNIIPDASFTFTPEVIGKAFWIQGGVV